MSHFSSADKSCKHGKDEVGREEGVGEDNEREEGTCFEKEWDEAGLRDREAKPARSSEVLFAAAEPKWHETMEVPITATDLSVLLMMRRSSSSLLPG
jgi:hypothetical protein